MVENEKLDIKFKNAVSLILNEIKVKVRQNKDKELLVEKVRFVTSLGDITYKPKKTIIKSTNFIGFKLEEDENLLYTIEEFQKSFEVISVLAKHTNEKPRKIICSFCEFEKHYDSNDEDVIYRFFKPYQFESIYYEEFHKKDTSNLTKMENWKIKQEEMSL